MRFRGVLMLIVALLAGVLAIVLASRWLQAQAGASQAGAVDVVVTTVDVPVGTPLTPTQLRVVKWPADTVPQGTFPNVDAVKGRVLTTSIQQGEPVLVRRLAAEGSKGGLTALLQPGRRAMTVRVNDVVGVAGFALPGTYVDVLVNTQEEPSGDGKPRMISKIVLERILVLAVAQDVEQDSGKPQVANAVTLEVTPEQAERLDLARSVGSLSLVLRNQTESAPAATQGATKDVLLGQATPRAPQPAPAPREAVRGAPAAVRPAPAPVARSCVEIVRAGARSTECF